MSERLSFRDRVAAYFKAQPHVWIDGDAFRTIGGKYAYRSRISDCRTELGMTIIMRNVKQKGHTHTLTWGQVLADAEAERVLAKRRVRSLGYVIRDVKRRVAAGESLEDLAKQRLKRAQKSA